MNSFTFIKQVGWCLQFDYFEIPVKFNDLTKYIFELSKGKTIQINYPEGSLKAKIKLFKYRNRTSYRIKYIRIGNKQGLIKFGKYLNTCQYIKITVMFPILYIEKENIEMKKDKVVGQPPVKIPHKYRNKTSNEREKQVFDFLKLNPNYKPAIREIAKAIGVSSTRTAFMYLQKLEQKGYIKIERHKARAIKILKERY